MRKSVPTDPEIFTELTFRTLYSSMVVKVESSTDNGYRLRSRPVSSNWGHQTTTDTLPLTVSSGTMEEGQMSLSLVINTNND